MTTFDSYSYLPDTVDIGGDIYSFGSKNSVNLAFKSRKLFQNTFGTNSETERLLRKYMNYSVQSKNKLVFDSPEDKTELIKILKRRANVLKTSNGFTSSTLKNEIFKRSYLYIQALITKLEGSNGKSIKVDSDACITVKKEVKDIKDDVKFQMILEMAWYLLHPDKVPSEIGCDWAKLVKELERLRVGDIVKQIHEDETKSSVEPSKNAFNYFKKINLQTVAKKDKIENALDQAKKFATEIQDETASDIIKKRLKLLLEILEMKKYLTKDSPIDEDSLKRSMITNPMKGGALAIPLGAAMNPLFDYFKAVYDPIYSFLEKSIIEYRKTNQIIIPQLTTLLHICNNLKPSTIATDKYITYRITNIDPEVLSFIKFMINTTNQHIGRITNNIDRNIFNKQIFKLPKVCLSSISDNALITVNNIYKNPTKLPSISFLTMEGNIEHNPDALDMNYGDAVTDYFTTNSIYIVYAELDNITENIPINLYDIDYSTIDISNNKIFITESDNYLTKNKQNLSETYFENLVNIKPYSVYNDAELSLSIFIALKELMPK